MKSSGGAEESTFPEAEEDGASMQSGGGLEALAPQLHCSGGLHKAAVLCLWQEADEGGQKIHLECHPGHSGLHLGGMLGSPQEYSWEGSLGVSWWKEESQFKPISQTIMKYLLASRRSSLTKPLPSSETCTGRMPSSWPCWSRAQWDPAEAVGGYAEQLFQQGAGLGSEARTSRLPPRRKAQSIWMILNLLQLMYNWWAMSHFCIEVQQRSLTFSDIALHWWMTILGMQVYQEQKTVCPLSSYSLVTSFEKFSKLIRKIDRTQREHKVGGNLQNISSSVILWF